MDEGLDPRTLPVTGPARTHRKLRRLGAAIALAFGVAAVAAADPYGFGNIRLGAPFDERARALDFRDIHAALDRQLAAKAARPDLGRRGYGCMRREDPCTEAAGVSHDDKVGDTPTRETRLQFLDGVLQQFSITADIAEIESVMALLRQEHGAPMETKRRRLAPLRLTIGATPILQLLRTAARVFCSCPLSWRATGKRWSDVNARRRPSAADPALHAACSALSQRPALGRSRRNPPVEARRRAAPAVRRDSPPRRSWERA